MKAVKFFSLLGASLVAPAALAASTWSVGQFLDGATASTALAANITAHATTGGGGTTIASALLCDYGASSGYGIVNSAEGSTCGVSAPEHSADNNGPTDMFLLKFNTAVKLTAVTIGWNGTDNWSSDSDISVLAYNAAGAPTINGKTLSNTPGTGLLGSNWQVVGNYSNVGAVEPDVVSTGATTYSSWWLISAWNTSFGGGFAPSTGSYIDYFKLISVTVDTPPPPGVPEPGSLALLGVGLLGLLRASRKNKQ